LDDNIYPVILGIFIFIIIIIGLTHLIINVGKAGKEALNIIKKIVTTTASAVVIANATFSVD